MNRMSDEDRDLAEGARLRRLGIDPDGDPVEIMRQLERLREAEAVDEPKVVDTPVEPR